MTNNTVYVLSCHLCCAVTPSFSPNIVGGLTRLVGVGGEFAIIPALVLLTKLPMKAAIGTSLFIIAMNAIAGFLGYLGQVTLDWRLIFSFILAASSGALLGTYLTQFVPATQLQKSFGYFLLAVAAFVLFQNRGVFSPKSAASAKVSLQAQVFIKDTF